MTASARLEYVILSGEHQAVMEVAILKVVSLLPILLALLEWKNGILSARDTRIQ